MAITLAYGATTLTLDPDLYWSDENNWHPVEQSVARTVTGSLVVQTATRSTGRPITLEPEDDSSGWMSRATLDTLRNWAAVAGRQMTLTLRGVSRTVMFRHQDGSAVDASPVVHYNDADNADWYKVVLRFMEI